MNVFSIYFVIAIYFTPLLVGYALTGHINSKEKIIGVWVAFSVVLIAIPTYFMAFSSEGWLDIAFHILSTLTRVLCVGIGLALGCWVKSLKIKEKRLHSNMLLAVALFFVPMIYSATDNLIATQKKTTKEDSKQAKLDKLQSLTVAEKFGNEAIHIAISAQLDLKYICWHHRYGSPNLKACKAIQSGHSYRSVDVSNRDAVAPVLQKLTIRPIKEKCEMEHATAKPCATHDAVSRWCERRQDLSGSIWCTNTLETPLEYRLHLTASSHDYNLKTEHWKFETKIPESQDFNGNPVEVSCSIAVDEKVARRERITGLPNLKPLERYCVINYKITTDIWVITNFYVKGPETLAPQARETYDISQSFWQEMKTREKVE